jgi:thiosulfate reductase cytochrome b subunit
MLFLAIGCAKVAGSNMPEPATVSVWALRTAEQDETPRHNALVRVTHGINTISFICLVISGIAILLAHPRLYWGETGGVGTPSLIDLPLPFVLAIPIRGPGRYLHFLSAWICVLNGSLYVVSGVISRHFHRNLMPGKRDLAWGSIAHVLSDHLNLVRPGEEASLSYNVVQRLTYLAVIFLLFPLTILTGLAMSPSIVSVFPLVVTIFGGQQSARTIHFFLALFLVLFFCVHIAMVCLAGFWNRTRAMIIGYDVPRKER